MPSPYIAVQIISKSSGIVVAQLRGALCDASGLEDKLRMRLLPDCQRLRTVQADHSSVAELEQREASAQLGRKDHHEPSSAVRLR